VPPRFDRCRPPPRRPAPDWRRAEAAGFGGDEVPPTLLLTHETADGSIAVIASHAPRVGPGTAWRASFNLRGPSSLYVEVAAAGPILLQTRSVALNATFLPLLAPSAFAGPDRARADGQAAVAWDVAAGWYLFRLNPVRGAQSVLDLSPASKLQGRTA
jgi:hypothetical protein